MLLPTRAFTLLAPLAPLALLAATTLAPLVAHAQRTA